MERTEPIVGRRKYFWQILTDSGESEVLNHFYRLEATYQQKKDGVSQFLNLANI